MDMNDQASSLRNQLKEGQQARTIAVVSGKGGVGKSNTAVNFSMKLLEAGKKVLLIDLDIGMGNIDILIGNTSTYTFADFFNQSMTFHDIIETGPKGLSYIAGGNSFDEFVVLSDQHLDYFLQQFESIQTSYDYIIFDLGAGATKIGMSFILAADECFVVMTPEPTAITDAYSMIKHIVVHNTDQPISLILNRVKNKKSGEQTIRRFTNVVYKFLKVDITTLGILPEDRIVIDAVIRQIPYVIFKNNAPISKAMGRMVNKFLSNNKDEDVKHYPSPFMNKVKKFLQRKKGILNNS